MIHSAKNSVLHRFGRHRLASGVILAAALVTTAYLATGVVPQTPTAEDRQVLVLTGVLGHADIDRAQQLDFAGQQALLTRIAAAVQRSITGLEPLPPEHAREPSDVLRARSGLCFDRARVIEKALRLSGFEVRRVFLLYGGWRNLFTAGSPTHAMVEVRTARGWVFVGTLSPMLGIDLEGRTWSMADLRNDAAHGGQAMKRNGWGEVIPMDFVPLTGLYSRTGLHYWPYTRMPDFSPVQVASVLTD